MTTETLNIDLPLNSEMRSFLAFMAKKKHKKSPSILIAEILKEAMEKEEDFYFSKMAEQRDLKGRKRIKHEEFWDRALQD